MTTTEVNRLGLFSLTADQTAVLDDVDAAIVEWARSVGARPERHTELIPAATLRLVDYFDSFPHLAHRVSPWLAEAAAEDAADELVLTSAACYGAYFARRDSARPPLELLTLRQVCRRREDHYLPLRRQREFQMREVVAIGEQAAVEDFLRTGRQFVAELAAARGVEGGFETATDPFFRRDDPRRLHQRLFPTKQEFVDESGLAISSVNMHANFFGERCALTLPDGSFVHTGCVAFGLERWVDALTRNTTPGESHRDDRRQVRLDQWIRSAAPAAPAISAAERVGGVWSGRLSVTKIWAAGMNNPLIAKGFWRYAYGTDAGSFYRDWERLADEPAGTRVLDVPSGAGVFLLGLAPGIDVDYTAVDISADMVDRVRARIAEKGLTTAKAIQADATRLPFDDKSTDLVLTYNGLHCFNEPWKALAEFRRVLVDGGRIRGTILLRRPGYTPNKVLDYFQWRGLLGTIGTWAEVQTWFHDAGLAVRRTEQNGALAFFEGGPA